MILTIKEPEVFRLLVEGRKTYEGRKWKEEYSSLKEGDLILFVLEGSGKLLLSEVTDLKEYSSIEEMIIDLWEELIPSAEDVDSVKELYSRYYSLSERAVAIGVRPVKLFSMGSRELRKWLGVRIPDTVRVAMGIENGELCSGHFGESDYFLVYDIRPDGYSFVERRDNPVKGSDLPPEERFKKVYELLKDCDVWVSFAHCPMCARVMKKSDKVLLPVGRKDPEEAARYLSDKYLDLSLRVTGKWRSGLQTSELVTEG